MIVYIYNIDVDLYNGFNGLRHRINWTYFTVLDGLAHPLYSREIARMLKVSRNTVRDVFDAADAAGVYWNTAYNLSESQINELLFPSNGIDVSYEQPDYAYVHKELLKVGVSLKMLWKEYVDQCKSTHKVYLKYSAFCNNYSNYVKKNKLTMHITHKPGDRIRNIYSI